MWVEYFTIPEDIDENRCTSQSHEIFLKSGSFSKIT